MTQEQFDFLAAIIRLYKQRLADASIPEKEKFPSLTEIGKLFGLTRQAISLRFKTLSRLGLMADRPQDLHRWPVELTDQGVAEFERWKKRQHLRVAS